MHSTYSWYQYTIACFYLSCSGIGHEKGDRPASLKARRPVMSSLEMFLWRNYLIFVSCTAPPSTNPSLMSSGDRSDKQTHTHIHTYVPTHPSCLQATGQTNRHTHTHIHVHACLYSCSSILEGSGRFSHLSNARDLFRKMVPLIRSEGEIREVVITALGLVHPLAFG